MWGYKPPDPNDLNNWTTGSSRIYKYRRFLVPDEYVTIVKQIDGKFATLTTQSTYQLKDLDQNELLLMIRRQELILITESTWSLDVHYLKTGGCNCGAWATSEPNQHSPICRLYKKESAE